MEQKRSSDVKDVIRSTRLLHTYRKQGGRGARMKKYIQLDNKIVGFVKITPEERAYYSPREIEHIFRIFGDGFGMSEILLETLREKYKVEKIYIIFRGRKLKASVQQFFDFGKEWKDGKNDWQLILPLSDFKVGGVVREVQEKLN